MAARTLSPEEREAKKKARIARSTAQRRARDIANPEAARERRRAERQRNRATYQARGKAYREANKERKRATDAAYLERNREKNRQQCKARYHAKKAEHAAMCKRYYEANKDAIREKRKAWRLENPEVRRALHRKRRAQKNGNGGTHTADDIKRLFALQCGKCAICFKSIKKERHVDHILPLALGGSNGPENLQLTCRLCNNRKHAKHPLDFARELGRLL